MNIQTEDTFRRSPEQNPTTQQSSQQNILLNAIRNKFANNNDNHSGNSPAVFSIPSLKQPQFKSGINLENGQTPSKLNQFLLGQLSEIKNSSNPGSFAIPNLQFQSKPNGTIPTLAEKLHLNSVTSESTIVSLNKGISDLRVCDENKTHIIDLTTALNRQSMLFASPSRQLVSSTPNPIDFQIPFIDCDLRETNVVGLPSRDEYCQTDVSDFVNTGFITEPSKFGKITCLRYRLPRRKLRVDHSFKAKHEISRFVFDTKSPDDIILASLRKYNKV